MHISLVVIDWSFQCFNNSQYNPSKWVFQVLQYETNTWQSERGQCLFTCSAAFWHGDWLCVGRLLRLPAATQTPGLFYPGVKILISNISSSDSHLKTVVLSSVSMWEIRRENKNIKHSWIPTGDLKTILMNYLFINIVYNENCVVPHLFGDFLEIDVWP